MKNNLPPQDLKGKKVAVVGAGFTGLVGALRLAERGAKVTIYEYHPTIGGLVRGFKLKNGVEVERAYHFLYKTDNYILDLAEELGVRDRLKFHRSSIGAFYEGVLYPLMTPIDLLKFKPLSFIDRIRTGVVGLYLQMVKDWRKLTEITAIDWLNKHNGKKATEILWEPLLRGKFHNYYDQVTMAWLWTRIKVRQDSKDRGEATEKLGYFDGSFNDVVSALESRLAELGAEIKLETGIETLTHSKKTDKISIKTLGGKSASFDGVLSTTPSGVFAKMTEANPQITKKYVSELSSIDYLAAATMVFTTPQKLSNYYWHQIHDKEAPFLVLLSLTALTGDTDKFDGNHLYYIGDYIPNDDELMNMSEKKITKKWFNGVKELFPEFDEKQVSESAVFKFRDAQHIVGTDYESKKPEYKTPIPHTYLANFSQIFPQDRGTNYAVRDGNEVAELLANDLLK